MPKGEVAGTHGRGTRAVLCCPKIASRPCLTALEGNRPRLLDHPRGLAYLLNPQSKVSYIYDDAGNRLSMTDGDGTTTSSYDAAIWSP